MSTGAEAFKKERGAPGRRGNGRSDGPESGSAGGGGDAGKYKSFGTGAGLNMDGRSIPAVCSGAVAAGGALW